jgi:uncharacterized spore protein YtfJ
MTEVGEVIKGARDALSVKRVFGDPYQQDGVTIIPVALVRGGAGGGQGESPEGTGRGFGSGFGVSARPAGAYIIKDGSVTWQPAVDVNRIVAGAQILAVAALFALRAMVKARAKARRAEAKAA